MLDCGGGCRWRSGKMRKVGWAVVEGSECHQECGLSSVSNSKL